MCAMEECAPRMAMSDANVSESSVEEGAEAGVKSPEAQRKPTSDVGESVEGSVDVFSSERELESLLENLSPIRTPARDNSIGRGPTGPNEWTLPVDVSGVGYSAESGIARSVCGERSEVCGTVIERNDATASDSGVGAQSPVTTPSHSRISVSDYSSSSYHFPSTPSSYLPSLQSIHAPRFSSLCEQPGSASETVPSESEKCRFLKDIDLSGSPLWPFLVDSLSSTTKQGGLCKWSGNDRPWEFSIKDTKLFATRWALANNSAPISYVKVARALKSFEKAQWCGLTLLRRVDGKKNTFRFLAEHNSPYLPRRASLSCIPPSFRHSTPLCPNPGGLPSSATSSSTPQPPFLPSPSFQNTPQYPLLPQFSHPSFSQQRFATFPSQTSPSMIPSREMVPYLPGPGGRVNYPSIPLDRSADIGQRPKPGLQAEFYGQRFHPYQQRAAVSRFVSPQAGVRMGQPGPLPRATFAPPPHSVPSPNGDDSGIYNC